MLKGDRALRLLQNDGVLLFLHLGGGVDNLKHACGAGPGSGSHVYQETQPLHRAIEHHHIGHHRKERPDRDRALNRQRAPNQQEEKDADHEDERERGPVVRPDLDNAETFGEPVFVGRVKLSQLVGLARKRLHHLDAGHALLHGGGKLAHLLLNALEARPDHHAEAQRQRQQQGQRNQSEQREAETLQHQCDNHAPEQQQRRQQIHQSHAGEALGLGDIARSPAHHIAGLRAVVKGKGKPLCCVVEMVAEVIGDAMGQPLTVIALTVCGDAAHYRNAENPPGGGEERGGALSPDALVDGVLQYLGDVQIEQRSKEYRDISKGRLLPIGTQIADKPPVNVFAGLRLLGSFHLHFFLR